MVAKAYHINSNLYHYAGNNPVKYTDPDGRYSWEQFKSDIGPAINLDFGYDYTQLASQAWKNEDSLRAVIYEIDAACEIIYDGLLAYNGAKSFSSLAKSCGMLKTTLSVLSPSSTVVLGKFNSGVWWRLYKNGG